VKKALVVVSEALAEASQPADKLPLLLASAALKLPRGDVTNAMADLVECHAVRQKQPVGHSQLRLVERYYLLRARCLHLQGPLTLADNLLDIIDIVNNSTDWKTSPSVVEEAKAATVTVSSCANGESHHCPPHHTTVRSGRQRRASRVLTHRLTLPPSFQHGHVLVSPIHCRSARPIVVHMCVHRCGRRRRVRRCRVLHRTRW
jgi:hypothetical protein